MPFNLVRICIQMADHRFITNNILFGLVYVDRLALSSLYINWHNLPAHLGDDIHNRETKTGQVYNSNKKIVRIQLKIDTEFNNQCYKRYKTVHRQKLACNNSTEKGFTKKKKKKEKL